MRKLIHTILALLVCAAAFAGSDVERCCARDENLTVGQWAAYEIDAPFGKKLESRYAIVGSETVDGQGLGKGVWLDPDVPFGMVRMTDSDGKGLRLVAYGDDAESLIARTASKDDELPPDARRLVELMVAAQEDPSPEAYKMFEQSIRQMTPEQRLQLLKGLERAAQEKP